jgi:peptide/nickel transport system ATP-binding protein
VSGPGANGRALLEVDDLVVRYRVPRGLSGAILRRPQRFVHAVSGVTLHVDRGEMVALVGESGCGKTTTAQAILRLVRSESGRVAFDGVDVTGLPQNDLRALRRRMQIIYQDPYESLDPRFRVSTTVAEPLVIHGIGTRGERRARVNYALEQVGLAPAERKSTVDGLLEVTGLTQHASKYPHQLSGGQKQRVAVARARAVEPKVIVADEPVSMLDVSVRAGILGILDELRDQGLAVLMITHDLSTAARFADRICVMYLGRIVEEGPARQVIEDPRHPYTKALLSVVPRRDPRHRTDVEILRGETPNPIDVPSGCRFHPRCPVAIDACREVDPELRTPVGERDHRAACILA